MIYLADSVFLQELAVNWHMWAQGADGNVYNGRTITWASIFQIWWISFLFFYCSILRI